MSEAKTKTNNDFPNKFVVCESRQKTVEVDGIEIQVQVPSEFAIDLNAPKLVGTFEADSGYTTMHSQSESKDVCVEILAQAPIDLNFCTPSSYVRLRMRITKEFAKSLREVLGGIK